MKAIYYTEYGPPEVLRLIEMEKPEPGDNEILIRMHATSVNFGDIAARKFRYLNSYEFHMPGFLKLPSRLMFGFWKPKKNILGNEFAGKVELVGSKVTRFKPGDPVFGYPAEKMGCYAEYMCMPENGMVTMKPENISFEEAATIPGGALTAMKLLQKIRIPAQAKVLVNGASGGIGAGGLQLLKYQYGAEVTAVCGTARMDFVKALGADRVIDYTRQDFTKEEVKYDLVFDILGKSNFKACKRILKDNGIYLNASFKTQKILQMWWTKLFGSKKVVCAMAFCKPEDLLRIKEWIEEGKLRSVIGKRFPLEQAAEAHRYLEEGKRTGYIVLNINT